MKLTMDWFEYRIVLLCLHPHRAEALSDDACLTSVCLYIGPKSRTERPRKTKIGTEVANVTRTPLSRSKVNLLLMS